jgi:hypothetical protein
LLVRAIGLATQMDHIVYFLGAGFSAPLGIPVMRNFLIKSRDMFSEDPKRYKHFEKVFQLIRDMNVAKSYYETDLFNIEEILSILEMRDQIGGKRAKRFIKYISDVILHYSPPVPVSDTTRYPANWHTRFLADAAIWQPYFYFVANLFNLRIGRPTGQVIFEVKADTVAARYSVLTLNYDLVLETISQFFTSSFRGGGRFHFAESYGKLAEGEVRLGKLHGSVGRDDIIAPTWNKGINKAMVKVWDGAHEILKQANQIRIIGYSLPLADAYIKYLLKSAVIDTPHLKQIDVLCRDSDGRTWERYRDFIKLDYARFADADVLSYLETIKQTTAGGVAITQDFLS